MSDRNYKPYSRKKLAHLLAHYETASALAEALEMSTSAVHAWHRGGNVTSTTRAKLDALYAQAREGIATVHTNQRTAAVIRAATEADQPQNGAKLKAAANGTLNLVQRVARLEHLVEGIAEALGVEC